MHNLNAQRDPPNHHDRHYLGGALALGASNVSAQEEGGVSCDAITTALGE